MNCLDVLAQQVIAMTAMEDCPVNDLYHPFARHTRIAT